MHRFGKYVPRKVVVSSAKYSRCQCDRANDVARVCSSNLQIAFARERRRRGTETVTNYPQCADEISGFFFPPELRKRTAAVAMINRPLCSGIRFVIRRLIGSFRIVKSLSLIDSAISIYFARRISHGFILIPYRNIFYSRHIAVIVFF